MADRLTQSLFPSRPFLYRLWRLYRYWRGAIPATLYYKNGVALGRRESIRLAWNYAKKGAGHAV